MTYMECVDLNPTPMDCVNSSQITATVSREAKDQNGPKVNCPLAQ